MDRLPNALRGDEPHNAYRSPVGLFGQNIRVHLRSDVEVNPAARAASLLKIGQNLEKTGKSAAALGYYRQVVKDYSNTPAAKTAAERIKALEPE